ncbi:MAG: branched-chain amino acid ABC transporter permease [Smithellaceae bacterium]|nr:branched-chain amino acid ABC transporter permease [Smithellaceae bacterium]
MLQGTLIYGFINSVVLALVALGFNLTFGISGVANFAHGALYILAGFTAWMVLNTLKLPFFLAAVLAVIFTAIAGALIYRFILLRVRGLPVSEVIASFGIGLAILEFFRFAGFVGFQYTLPMFINDSVSIGGTYVDIQRLIIVAVGIVLAILLYFFTHHTKTGLAFRGIAQDERTALVLGINSDRMATFSVAFGAGFAAIAAIVILPLGTIAVEGGYAVLLNALAVCIVGGLGSTIGVVAASFIIGFSQTLTATYLGSHWLMIVSLVAILVVLVIKPSGLFGSQKELEERI